MERLTHKDINMKVHNFWTENPKSGEGRYGFWRDTAQVSDMLGKIITNITLPNEEDSQDMILFECTDGSAYLMYHEQDCCENVEIDDINGDLDNLIGRPLAMADVATSGDRPDLDRGAREESWDDSHTWTFYRFGTVRGFVDIRWYGSSNGYYSESVDFVKLK